MVLTMRWSGLKFEIIFESIRLQLSTDQTVRGSLITIKFMQLNTQTFSDLTQLQTLFYTHQDEKYVSKDHSYPLVGGLSPTVSQASKDVSVDRPPVHSWTDERKSVRRDLL